MKNNYFFFKADLIAKFSNQFFGLGTGGHIDSWYSGGIGYVKIYPNVFTKEVEQSLDKILNQICYPDNYIKLTDTQRKQLVSLLP